MWRLTIVANAVLMAAFWLASLVPISIVHNRFVQYPDPGEGHELATITAVAWAIKDWLGIIPLGWLALCAAVWWRCRKQEPQSRAEELLALTTCTVTVGAFMSLFFFGAAAASLLRIGIIME